MAETETIKLDKKNYLHIKKMLQSSDEDFEVGSEMIQNIEMSGVCKILFAKCLVYRRRAEFINRFEGEINATAQTCFKTGSGGVGTVDRHGTNIIDYSWEFLFPMFKDQELTKLEKEIIQYEIEHLIMTTLKGLDYNFIKSIKTDLKW